MLGFAIPHSTGWRQNLQGYISLCNEAGSRVVTLFAFFGTLLGSLPLHLTALRYQTVILTFLIIIFPLVLPSKCEILQWSSCWQKRYPKIKQTNSWSKSLQTSGYKKTSGSGTTTNCSGTVTENLTRVVNDYCQISFSVNPAGFPKIILTMLLKAE